MKTCINCRYSRKYESGDFVIWHKDTLVCGVEGVAMDPNDSCDVFELPITKAMIEEYSFRNQVSLTIANLYLNGYGII